MLYDKAVLENKWNYPLTTDLPGPKNNARELQNRLPPFTHDLFIQYLVHYIIADDQVSAFLFLNSCLTS